LQELAGIVNPFDERIRAEARQEAKAAAEVEVAAVRAELEERLAGLRADVEGEVAARLRSRLLAMSGFPQKPGEG